MSASTLISLRLPTSLLAELDRFCAEHDQSRSDVLVGALRALGPRIRSDPWSCRRVHVNDNGRCTPLYPDDLPPTEGLVLDLVAPEAFWAWLDWTGDR